MVYGRPTTLESPAPHVTAKADRDSLLWAGLRNGSRTALEQLYKAHLATLYKYGMYVCRDTEMINDCVHELFAKLWAKHERLAPANNVRSYLIRSLQRLIVAQLLRNRKLFAERATVAELPDDSFEQEIIDQELRKERLAEIKKCLHSLPKCQREVILLRFFNDLSYPEISEVMQLQVVSVYNLASKAIEQLRHKVQFQSVSA